MPLQPNIALQVQGLQLPDPLAQSGRVAQIQNALQQQQLTGMQIRQLEEDRREMMDLQRKLTEMGQNPDLRAVAQTLMRSPKTLQVGAQMIEKLNEQDAFARYLEGRKTAEPTGGAVASPVPMTRERTVPELPVSTDAVDAARPMNAMAPAAGVSNALLRSPAEIRQEMTDLARFPNIPQAKARMDILKTELAEAVKPPTLHNVPGVGAVNPRTGQTVVSEVQRPDEFERSIQSLPPAEQARLRKARAEKLATHPPVAGELTAAQLQKLKKEAADANTAATATIDTVSDLRKAIKDLRTSPGLSAATGYSGVLFPSFTEGEAAQAEVRLEALKGKITAFGKAAASQTGAIGSIANQEWKILADQVAAINPIKGKKPMLEQLANLEQQLDRLVTRVESSYKDLYGADENVPASLRELRSGRGSAGGDSGLSVTAPNGETYTFPTQQQADQYRARISGGR
jgi:hypothetical protein